MTEDLYYSIVSSASAISKELVKQSALTNNEFIVNVYGRPISESNGAKRLGFSRCRNQIAELQCSFLKDGERFYSEHEEMAYKHCSKVIFEKYNITDIDVLFIRVVLDLDRHDAEITEDTLFMVKHIDSIVSDVSKQHYKVLMSLEKNDFDILYDKLKDNISTDITLDRENNTIIYNC